MLEAKIPRPSKSAGHSYGANRYIRKPVEFDQFAEVIHHLGLYRLGGQRAAANIRDI